jgi:hypothetical protein
VRFQRRRLRTIVINPNLHLVGGGAQLFPIDWWPSHRQYPGSVLEYRTQSSALLIVQARAIGYWSAVTRATI